MNTHRNTHFFLTFNFRHIIQQKIGMCLWHSSGCRIDLFAHNRRFAVLEEILVLKKKIVKIKSFFFFQKQLWSNTLPLDAETTGRNLDRNVH